MPTVREDEKTARSTVRPRAGMENRGNRGEAVEPSSNSSFTGITPEEARKLTSEQRMHLLASGGLVFNSGNQTAFLTGVIAGLTKDEIQKAGDILGGIQDRGNFQAQEVWDAFWKQWGRVDPARCLKFFGPGAVSKSEADARNVMAGWLETDPDGALAWAQGVKESSLETAAAARAITNASGGNLKQMRADIAAIPEENTRTRQQCMQDYFDTALLSGADSTVSSIYGELPESLRESAWPVALKRMTMEDPKAAAAWFESNRNASSWSSVATADLADRLAAQDPAGTIHWLLSLPGAETSGEQGYDPVRRALNRWLEKDPVAAKQWQDSQPAGSLWGRDVIYQDH